MALSSSGVLHCGFKIVCLKLRSNQVIVHVSKSNTWCLLKEVGFRKCSISIKLLQLLKLQIMSVIKSGLSYYLILINVVQFSLQFRSPVLLWLREGILFKTIEPHPPSCSGSLHCGLLLYTTINIW